MVSRGMEDYLAAIWRLSRRGDPATTGEVARKLGVSAASATNMFRRLGEADLVSYKEYSGVQLTEQGLRAAVSVIRRHRLTERFLVDVLAIPWEQVDSIVDQMEHSLPDVVIDRFDHILGYPSTCPHGHPIPTADGQVVTEPVRPLAELEPGEQTVISRVAEHDPRLLSYLHENRLVPGAPVRVLEKDRIGETMTLAAGEGERCHRVTVGAPVINAIWVATTRAAEGQ